MGLEGAKEGKGVAGKSHTGSLTNKRHPVRIWVSLPSQLRAGISSGPRLGEAGTNTRSGKDVAVLRFRCQQRHAYKGTLNACVCVCTHECKQEMKPLWSKISSGNEEWLRSDGSPFLMRSVNQHPHMFIRNKSIKTVSLDSTEWSEFLNVFLRCINWFFAFSPLFYSMYRLHVLLLALAHGQCNINMLKLNLQKYSNQNLTTGVRFNGTSYLT